MKDLETLFREHYVACENIISRPSGDIVSQITELQEMLEAVDLDELLQKIQYEAFAAGFIEGSVHGGSVYCAQSLDYLVCDSFEEWVNNND